MLKRCPGSTAAAASCGDRTLAWQPWPSVTEVCVEGQKQREFIACGKEDSDWWSFSKRWRRASLVYKAVVPASKWIKMSITQNTPFSLLKFLGISTDIWCVWWRFITYPLQPPNTHTHTHTHSFTLSSEEALGFTSGVYGPGLSNQSISCPWLQIDSGLLEELPEGSGSLSLHLNPRRCSGWSCCSHLAIMWNLRGTHYFLHSI